MCFQDATHMVVKAHRALMTKSLKIGSSIASRATIIALTKACPKMIIGINESDLTEDKDNMNYPIAERVCSTNVTGRLIRPEERGTRLFLMLNRHIITAYIQHNTSPDQRIFSSWYVAFFLRLWKEYLKANSSHGEKKADLLRTTIDRNFVSSNLHGCVEINGHNMLLMHNRCRDSGQPELFLPSKANSQTCEKSFRHLRSMSTTKSTVVNFDILEVLQKGKRIGLLDTIASSSVDFKFKENSKKDIFIPEALLTDEEINNIVGSGFGKAQNEFKELRKF